MSALRRFCGSHVTHASWTLGTVATLLTVLSLLGLLPWATRAEVIEHKGHVSETLKRIDQRVDAIYRALIGRDGAP